MKADPAIINKRHQHGVSLIEVLITMVVLAIGLLGFSALQTVSMKSNSNALYRSYATMYAYEIADCMRANRVAARANAYNIAFDDSAPSSPTTIAGKDLKNWLDALAATLPNGDGRVAVANGIATIEVRWNEGTDSSGNPILKKFSTQSSLRP